MMYRPNFYESTCLRCNEIVYQVDRVGPLKDFTFFHAGCFKCANCGTKLTLKTYYNNQHKQEDKEVIQYSIFTLRHIETHESTFDPYTIHHRRCRHHRHSCHVSRLLLQVYCNSHVPKSGPGHFDQTSVGIRQALNAPKSNKFVNEQIRGGSRDLEGKSFTKNRKTQRKKTKYENVKARWTLTRAHTPFDGWLSTFALTLCSFIRPLSTLHCAPNEVITTPTCTCTRKQKWIYINRNEHQWRRRCDAKSRKTKTKSIRARNLWSIKSKQNEFMCSNYVDLALDTKWKIDSFDTCARVFFSFDFYSE